MNTDSGKSKKRWEIPHILVILIVMSAMSALLTWVLPAGAYDRAYNEVTGHLTAVPGTFHYIERTPVSFFELFISLEESLVATADIAFMIF